MSHTQKHIAHTSHSSHIFCVDTHTHTQSFEFIHISAAAPTQQYPIILRKSHRQPLQGFFSLPGIIRASLLDKLITELEKQKFNSHPPSP